MVEKQLDGRGGKADEGKSGREEKSAAKLPRSFSWDFSRWLRKVKSQNGNAAHLPRFLFLEEISAQGAEKLL